MRDFRDAKAMAQSLREALAAKKISVSHSESLELVAKTLGVADWNTLSAILNNNLSGLASSATGEIARRRAEQEAPRQVVPFDPSHFEQYVGYYYVEDYPGTLSPTVMIVTREGGRFFAQMPDLERVELYPESETKLFAKNIDAQASFYADAEGNVTHLVQHYMGHERAFRKIDVAEAKAIIAARTARLAANMQSPGTEDALRRFLVSAANGQPDYDSMAPVLAENWRAQWPLRQAIVKGRGAPKSITFLHLDPKGYDVYDVEYENGRVKWSISPPGPDGKVALMGGRVIS
jgi:hypothetical protein